MRMPHGTTFPINGYSFNLNALKADDEIAFVHERLSPLSGRFAQWVCEYLFLSPVLDRVGAVA